MAPNQSEVEPDKSVEYASVKFLLKQVYAAHVTKIKELEAEVKDLKEKLEEAKKEIASASSECANCKKIELAYSACKEEYKNAVLEQTKRLNEFEKIFSTMESARKSSGDESNVKVCPPKRNSENCATSSNKNLQQQSQSLCTEDLLLNTEFVLPVEEVDKMCNTAKIQDKLQKKGAISQLLPLLPKTLLEHSPAKLDDVVLVPDTEDLLSNPKPSSSREPKLNEKTKSSPKKSEKENNSEPKENNGKTKAKQSMLSKKRTLSELTINEVTTSKKRNSLEDNNATLPKRKSDKNEESVTQIVKQKKLPTDGANWANNFDDFQKLPNKQNSTVSKLRKSDEDIVKILEENGSWKTSLKKSVAKETVAKNIKSTSKFKMTLDSPDFNTKKTNYKQTTLSKINFLSKTTVETKNKGEFSNNEETQQTLSQLVAFSDSDPTFAACADFGKTLDSRICESETLCPLKLIAENNPKKKQIKKNVEQKTAEKSSSGESSDVVLLEDDNSHKEDVFIGAASDDSFDRVPLREEPNYKYKEDPVRNKDKRKQLNGFDCKECEKYYSELGLSEGEKKHRLKQCSKHRAKHAAPATPDNFWELEFPDTQECRARGYLKETQKVYLKSRRRRPLVSA